MTTPITQLIDAAASQHGATIVTLLRVGGQKAVIHVRTSNGKDAAMKVVLLEGEHADVARERARREVHLLARIDNPHVVKVLSAVADHAAPLRAATWLEELLPGEDLSEVMNVPWDWPSTLALAWCLAEGLAAFHRMGVVHRDLSAGNVRKISDGHYTIIDPGLARHLARTSLTGAFQPGTLGYMSPEHVSGQPGTASDIFCVGILLYRVLTGDLPIPVGAHMNDYGVRLRDARVSPLGARRPDLPNDVCSLVSRCLDRQPARRYLDGTELKTAVEAIVEPRTS